MVKGIFRFGVFQIQEGDRKEKIIYMSLYVADKEVHCESSDIVYRLFIIVKRINKSGIIDKIWTCEFFRYTIARNATCLVKNIADGVSKLNIEESPCHIIQLQVHLTCRYLLCQTSHSVNWTHLRVPYRKPHYVAYFLT
jgi:hypothetical protein